MESTLVDPTPTQPIGRQQLADEAKSESVDSKKPIDTHESNLADLQKSIKAYESESVDLQQPIGIYEHGPSEESVETSESDPIMGSGRRPNPHNMPVNMFY